MDLYLRHCYRNRTAVRASELARFMGLAPGSLSRVAKLYLGVSPRMALRDRQVAEASRLLRGTRLSVENIALRCGFGTKNTLLRVFVRATGLTPTAFRGVKN